MIECCADIQVIEFQGIKVRVSKIEVVHVSKIEALHVPQNKFIETKLKLALATAMATRR